MSSELILTSAQVERYREELHRLFQHHSGVDALCDMALRSIAQPQGERVVSEPRVEAGAMGPVLDKPAQIGNGIFHPGVSWRTVILRAQREYEYQQTPDNEAERLRKVGAFRDALNTVKPSGTLICPRCEVDRLKAGCPEMRPGLCPMVGEAYGPYMKRESKDAG